MNKQFEISLKLDSANFKVLEITGKRGDHLARHKINENGILIVKSGQIIFTNDSGSKLLKKNNCIEIEQQDIHEVHCERKAMFHLILPKSTKMRFERT